mgnify:CR=1 FL=1
MLTTTHWGKFYYSIFIWVSESTESIINFLNIAELIGYMWALENVGLIEIFYLTKMHQQLMGMWYLFEM